MNHSIIGLDIAKNVFYIYTIQENGTVFKKMLRRQEVLVFFANYPSSLIGIEACGSSHYWSRELIKLGHDVKLFNARHVKAFVKGTKNDFNDAEAIFDVVSRPNVRTIAIKTEEQQDIQLIHRLRQEATKRRTALVNQLRGLLSERGIVIGQGVDHVRKRYWGQHLWARGYWVASSGNVTDEVWKKYIEEQRPDEPDDDFRVL